MIEEGTRVKVVVDSGSMPAFYRGKFVGGGLGPQDTFEIKDHDGKSIVIPGRRIVAVEEALV